MCHHQESDGAILVAKRRLRRTRLRQGVFCVPESKSDEQTASVVITSLGSERHLSPVGRRYGGSSDRDETRQQVPCCRYRVSDALAGGDRGTRQVSRRNPPLSHGTCLSLWIVSYSPSRPGARIQQPAVQGPLQTATNFTSNDISVSSSVERVSSSKHLPLSSLM